MMIDNISWTAIAQFLQSAGVLGLLVFIIIGGARQWWVFGWQYRDLVQREAQWKEMAQRQIDANERAVELAELMRVRDGKAPQR